jgi:predicted nucleotidyltransferase
MDRTRSSIMQASNLQSRGELILAAALTLAQQKWRQRLLAAYALGSLAHGGFSAASDIDIGLVLDDPLLSTDSEAVRELTASIKATGRPFADRLSIFWGSVASLSGISPGGRFPPLDRLDLIKHGRLLAGSDVRNKLPPPTHKELVLAGAEFALRRLCTDDIIGKLKNPEALAQSDPRTLTKLILFPVRFMFTAQTGEVGRNDAAVDYFVAAAPGVSSALARLALDWRNAEDWAGDNSAAHAIAAGVLPLYRDFVSDHEQRMREYGRPDLAEAFQKWQQRLE